MRLRKIWTEEEINFLNLNFPLKGAKFCAKSLGLTKHQVSYKCAALGIKFDIRNIAQIRQKPLEKFKVNCELFMNPTKPEIAYLLGFIWGDGHVRCNSKEHRIIITGIAEDLMVIKPIFDISGNWNCRLTTPKQSQDGYNRKEICTLKTSNKPLVEFLADNNYLIKSGGSPEKILKIIPNHLKSYFLLGLIDADGCFHFSRQYSKNKKDGWSRRCIIASTYDQNWGSIQKILSDLEIKSFITRRISKTGKSSTLTISGMRGITALYNFIYPQGFQFGLKRKYDKCQECIIPRPKSKLNPITN